MSTATRPMVTLGDVLTRLHYIPADRIRLTPTPGTATVADAIEFAHRLNIACEMYDGVIVEKPMGYFESWIGMILGAKIMTYLEGNDLGILTGEKAPLWVAPDQMREPDLAFFAWSKFPGRVLPRNPILDHVPDLAIEILSGSNTVGEMERKRREYFAGGATLVWEIDPADRTARVYTSVDQFTELRDGDCLDGGTVLPGFSVSLAELFERAGRPPES